jgi:hypothetical protein
MLHLSPLVAYTLTFCQEMKRLIHASLILRCVVHAQEPAIPNSVEPRIPDAWKEQPPEFKVDLKNLKFGPLGYRIESTDFEADPDRQLVVILEGTGRGFEIIEVRGKYSTEKKIEEWSIYYHDGSPLLAQLKKWNKVSIAGEDLGEGLSKVETFLADGGKFKIDGKDETKRILDMTAFAEKTQAEQAGTGQPATQSRQVKD